VTLAGRVVGPTANRWAEERSPSDLGRPADKVAKPTTDGVNGC